MNRTSRLSNFPCRRFRCFPVVMGVLLIGLAFVSHGGEPVESGFRDFSYGNTCNSTPTGSKPESKLWFNDGVWWGSLCDGSVSKYYIHRFDLPAQTWLNTGVQLDDRPGSKADTLWDGQKLYVASHRMNAKGQPTTNQSRWGRLYRYSYSLGTQTYSLDPGFPVNVTRGSSETLTLAKDSTGQLWVTYVESQTVMINHSSAGGDNVWAAPFALPVTEAAGVSSDDISGVIALEDGRIGVMWSNQITQQMYFAVHADGDPDTTWQSVAAYAPGGPAADDHINLKTFEGRVYAVTKTSFSGSTQPLINLLVCTAGDCTVASNWQAHTVYQVQDHYTRPILFIDTLARRLHVFATHPESGGAIFHKSASLDDIQFETGGGTPFIQSASDSKINNPTSTKQNLDTASGVLVLASEQVSHFYFHNFLAPGATPPPEEPPVISIRHQETRTGGSTESATVATSVELAAVSGDLYLAAIASKPMLANGVSSVSGLGLTWTRLAVQCSARSQTALELWMAQGTPEGAGGAVTATLSVVPRNAVIIVSRYSGASTVDPVGNMISGNTLGINGACSGGVDNKSYSFNLTAGDGTLVYGAAAMRYVGHTPGTGYTERAEIHQGVSGAVAGAAAEDKAVPAASVVAVNGSFSSNVDWAMIGLEIKP